MTAQLVGSKEFKAFLEKVVKDGKHDMDKLMEKSARETGNIAKNNIQGGTRSGKVYRRGTVSHTSSAIGEFPKTDTGTLVRNITHEKEGVADYTVGSRRGAPHGFFLEMKSPISGGRPWLLPSVKEFIKKFEIEAKKTIR